MTRIFRPSTARRRAEVARPGAKTWIAVAAAALAVVTLVATLPAHLAESTTVAKDQAQSLDIVDSAVLSVTARDSYTASAPNAETYISGGTNRDWAALVLFYGEWPVTDENVTVIMRWMRQENYVKSWWNRNNPLNNGWGSGGGGGTGSYASLRDAALNAAEALHTLPGYAGIRESFAASAPTATTEAAIWASPWASGHYNNGAHWHYSDVEIIAAPASAW
ncbi:hypothetical protein C2138_00645 [Salinibacterium hongtaonis]|nr:hypothetical protein C2138_00645 [Salinibacterium hongtaonis]